jgi:hypothetical protein
MKNLNCFHEILRTLVFFHLVLVSSLNSSLAAPVFVAKKENLNSKIKSAEIFFAKTLPKTKSIKEWLSIVKIMDRKLPVLEKSFREVIDPYMIQALEMGDLDFEWFKELQKNEFDLGQKNLTSNTSNYSIIRNFLYPNVYQKRDELRTDLEKMNLQIRRMKSFLLCNEIKKLSEEIIFLDFENVKKDLEAMSVLSYPVSNTAAKIEFLAHKIANILFGFIEIRTKQGAVLELNDLAAKDFISQAALYGYKIKKLEKTSGTTHSYSIEKTRFPTCHSLLIQIKKLFSF